jgi:Cu/Ag efflux protein CusF
MGLTGCDKKVKAPKVEASADAMGDMAPTAVKHGKGTGTVTAIDPAKGTITLDYGEVSELQWPAMKMGFAKANGWTSIKLSGGDKFKKAAYLAATAQGLAVENYSPSKVVQAEADRLRARLAEREQRREGKKAGGKNPRDEDELSKLKALSERFLSQSHAENARDPELRRAQSLVAQTISIARAKYPDDPVKASKEIEARRSEVAIRIAKGDKIAIVQVRNQRAQRVREITQDQVLQRGGRSR